MLKNRTRNGLISRVKYDKNNVFFKQIIKSKYEENYYKDFFISVKPVRRLIPELKNVKVNNDFICFRIDYMTNRNRSFSSIINRGNFFKNLMIRIDFFNIENKNIIYELKIPAILGEDYGGDNHNKNDNEKDKEKKQIPENSLKINCVSTYKNEINYKAIFWSKENNYIYIVNSQEKREEISCIYVKNIGRFYGFILPYNELWTEIVKKMFNTNSIDLKLIKNLPASISFEKKILANENEIKEVLAICKKPL